MEKLFDADYLSRILNGQWITSPPEGWNFETVAISKQQCTLEEGKRILFIAIDDETWHQGSGNRGIYSGWNDTHNTVSSFQDKICGVIVQRYIEDLNPNIPQLLVDNSYDVINVIAENVRKKLKGKVIALTGTAGKSTTKELLKFLLQDDGKVVATRGNHNTRTGVPLTVACGITEPNYMVLEVAISALWMKTGGICKNLAPHIGIVTEIGGGQQKTPFETAKLKSRICEGIVPGGIALLNKDMMHFDVVKNEVESFGAQVVTYGFDKTADAYLIETSIQKRGTKVKANILGEIVEFDTLLIGDGMIRNTLAALTTVKLLKLDVQDASKRIVAYKGKKSVLEFVEIDHYKGGQFTLLDDSWNATEVSMIQAINILKEQKSFFKGKTIAILGRIENLGEDAERQHKRLVQPLIDSGIDLLFAHGPEMKYVLKELPVEMIGGYYEDAKSCAKAASRYINPGDLVLLKGSPRSSDFKYMKQELIKFAKSNESISYSNLGNNLATNHIAVTYDLERDSIMSTIGNKDTVQNQGLGNILLLSLILDKIFAKQINLHDNVTINKQAANESKASRSIPLKEKEIVKFNDLLDAFIINDSPNAMLAIAAHLYGNSNNALKEIKALANKLSISEESVENVTGRRIPNSLQKVSIDDLYKATKHLFDRLPNELSHFSKSVMIYKNKTYYSASTLQDRGIVNQIVLCGQNKSIALALSRRGNKKLITLVIGARDAFHRDYLVEQSIKQAFEKNLNNESRKNNYLEVTGRNEYKVNVLGDTYFGEFYTDIRKKRNRLDALTKYGYQYSFDAIRPLLNTGEFNIANFEASLTHTKESKLKPSKPYVLYASPDETINTLKHENIKAVTLGNNHLMDFGDEGIHTTLQSFLQAEIISFGAGLNIEDAEKPLIKIINGKRVVFYSAYWYRQTMHKKYNFYADIDSPGVACLSGGLIENIKEEKRKYPESYIVVFAHWGVDFENVQPLQRRYAHVLVNAGVDLILGHGAHMMQEIEKINGKWIVYSLGNGVFNSNGEYHTRHVAPYSMIAQLHFIGENTFLNLYPIYSNNLETFWQPRMLTDLQFEHFLKIQQTLGLETDNNQEVLMKKDKFGNFIRIEL